jgi:hypothetical protein
MKECPACKERCNKELYRKVIQNDYDSCLADIIVVYGCMNCNNLFYDEE